MKKKEIYFIFIYLLFFINIYNKKIFMFYYLLLSK